MELSENVHCVFSARIEIRQGEPIITVPDSELKIGDLTHGESYRVAILAAPEGSEPASEPEGAPVVEGEHYEVEIKDIGEQGDGVAQIGPGYIVFVPGTDLGDRVTVEITQAQENFGFAEVIEDEPLSG